MSGLTLEVRDSMGNVKVYKHAEQLGKLTRDSIRNAWFAIGKDLKAEAKSEILRKPKGGRVYIIRSGGRRRRHVASAPGETHANMTGKLRKSIGWKVGSPDTMVFGYGVTGSDDPYYASYVEFGTRRMSARPSLGNAINKMQRNTEKHFAAAFQKETKSK